MFAAALALASSDLGGCAQRLGAAAPSFSLGRLADCGADSAACWVPGQRRDLRGSYADVLD